MKIPQITCTLIFLFFSVSALAQKDTVFWFAAPDVFQNGASNFDRPIFLRLSSFATAATVTISQPAGAGMPTQVVSIPANSSVFVNLSSWINVIENQPANVVLNYGIKVQSTAPIIAYYHVESDAFCYCNPEIFTLKGKQALGTDFWIPGQDFWNNGTSFSTPPTNSFDVVATQNGTIVTITPSNTIAGHTGGTAFTINLNRGQTYSATSTSVMGSNHLQGSRVTSNNPIAITVKDDLLEYTGPSGNGLDLTGDQIVSTNFLGTEYIAMKGVLYGPPGDKVFVTATQSGTTLSQNGSFVTTLTAGQTYQLSIPGTSTYIQTSLPAYVYQVTGLGFEISSALLPPLICTGSQEVSAMQSSTLQLYLNLLVRNGGQGNFLLNGLSGVITSGAFTTVPGTSGAWYSAQIPLSTTTYGYGTTLNIKNTSDLFQAGMLTGFPTGKGTSYGYFADYLPQDTVHNTFDTTICIFASAANLSVPLGYNSYLWNTGAITSSILISSAGTYWCKGTSSCGVLLDTFHVTLAPPDTTFFTLDTSICALTDSAILTAPSGYTSYRWSTGGIQPVLAVFNSGTFWVMATDVANCKVKKTIFNVHFVLPDTVLIYKDTSICALADSMVLRCSSGYSSYLWNTGSINPTVTVTNGGTYWGMASDDANCKIIKTIFTVHFTLPDTNFRTSDTELCVSSVPISLIAPGGYANYLWNTGTVGNTNPVSAAGTYWVRAISIPGCLILTDTIRVTLKPAPVVGLRSDTAICTGDQITLTSIQPTEGDVSYKWNTGSTAASIVVSKSGVYAVTITKKGCTGSDSVYIDELSKPAGIFIGPDTVLCQGESLTLNTNIAATTWSTGTHR